MSRWSSWASRQGCSWACSPRITGPHPAPATPRSLACYGLGLGLVLEVVGLVLIVRSGAFRSNLRSPLLPLTRAQRRGLLRQVLGRRPTEPATLDLGRDLARRLAAQIPALPLIFAGLALTGAGRMAGHPTAVRITIETVGIVLLLTAAAFGVRQGRSARRFLAEHPADEGAGS